MTRRKDVKDPDPSKLVCPNCRTMRFIGRTSLVCPGCMGKIEQISSKQRIRLVRQFPEFSMSFRGKPRAAQSPEKE